MDNDNFIQVRLFRNNHPVVRCIANYVGLLGMQIDAGPLMYQKGTHLEVELMLNEGDGKLRCRLPAVVTNHSIDGLGLTFMNHDMHSNSILQEIILEQDAHEMFA